MGLSRCAGRRRSSIGRMNDAQNWSVIRIVKAIPRTHTTTDLGLYFFNNIYNMVAYIGIHINRPEYKYINWSKNSEWKLFTNSVTFVSISINVSIITSPPNHYIPFVNTPLPAFQEYLYYHRFFHLSLKHQDYTQYTHCLSLYPYTPAL